MEGLIPVLQELAAKFPWVSIVLMVLGSLVTVASAIIALTNTKVDDEAKAKALAIPVLGSFILLLENFSIFNLKK